MMESRWMHEYMGMAVTSDWLNGKVKGPIREDVKQQAAPRRE
jgi:hypothetical protein